MHSANCNTIKFLIKQIHHNQRSLRRSVAKIVYDNVNERPFTSFAYENSRIIAQRKVNDISAVDVCLI